MLALLPRRRMQGTRLHRGPIDAPSGAPHHRWWYRAPRTSISLLSPGPELDTHPRQPGLLSHCPSPLHWLADQQLTRPNFTHLITCVSCSQRVHVTPSGGIGGEKSGRFGGLKGLFWVSGCRRVQGEEEDQEGEGARPLSLVGSSSFRTSRSAWARWARICWRAALGSRSRRAA